MKRIILTFLACGFALTPALAQTTSRSAAGYYGGYSGQYLGNPYVGSGNLNYRNPYVGSPYGGGYNPGYSGGYNNPWVNPYGNPYAYNGVPINSFGAPVSVGNGLFGMASNGHNFNFWKSPSGYYYPWTAGYGSNYTAPIVVINNGMSQPAQPPLSTVFSDTLKYLDEQKAAGKLAEPDFIHLKQRALDLLSKEKSLRSEGGGSLDPSQETSIRTDVDSLGGEIARRVKP
jgi:hypothetical protein